MTPEEFEKLLPGDKVKIQWMAGAKVYDVTVLEPRSYDADPEPETVYCVGKSISGEFTASQVTFVSHSPPIEALLNKSSAAADSELMDRLQKRVAALEDAIQQVFDAASLAKLLRNS